MYYNGVFDCFAKMYRKEGLRALWKGIVPPILAETPKRATKFVCFEQYKRFFMFGRDKATPLVSFYAVIKDMLQKNNPRRWRSDVLAGRTWRRHHRGHNR